MLRMIGGRVKVIGDVTELVSILRALNTEVKKEVYQEIVRDWKSSDEIEEKYGSEGKEALQFFEKMKLVETRWEPEEEGAKKVYKSYYTSFHINASAPVHEISDVLTVAIMSVEEFKSYEDRILEMLSDGDKYVGDISEALNVSQTMLRSLARRSIHFEYRGQRIEQVKS